MSGGNSLFPVGGGGQSLLNFRLNLQISDNPPPSPHLHSKRLFLSSGFSTVLGQNFRNFRHCEKLSLSWTGDFDLLKNYVKVRKLKDNLKLHGEKYKNSGCQTFTVMMKIFGCIAELMLDGIALLPVADVEYKFIRENFPEEGEELIHYILM